MDETNGDFADRAEQHPKAIRRLEAQAIGAATQPLARALNAAQQDATTRWLHAAAGRPAPEPTVLARLIETIRRLLARAFRGQGARAQRAAEQAATAAEQLGETQAAAIAAAMSGEPPPHRDRRRSSRRHAQAAWDVAAGIPAAVEQEFRRALALCTEQTVRAFRGFTGVFQRAKRAIGRIAAGVAVTVATAAAVGAETIARTLGARLLWVAEPGACSACAAYAGRSIAPGEYFPGGLSLDPRRTVFWTPIPGPPRHPRCRCALIPWRSEWNRGGTPLPDLLRMRARMGGH
ncbi:hypothetical protein ACIOEX_01580 [Streptomyces sp. NPDC087850]|uniref:hypothetical protein n=1 Tax=Streptomyces sp. NPDC087850 TaxID=3365809 RepID=UPI00382409A1